MLVLGNPKEAAEVFDSILEKYGKDEAFLSAEGGRGRIMWIELKREPPTAKWAMLPRLTPWSSGS